MGFMRKMTSISTGGLVDFRSDKERTAAYTKQAKKEAKKQTQLQRELLAQQQAAARAAQQQAARSAQATASAPLVPSTPAPSDPMVDELSRLASLHQSGDLTDEEYRAAKAKLLGLPG